MTTYIRVLHPDGSLHPVDYQADNLAAAAKFEPHDGVYTVTNTYNTTQVLKMNAHLDRLEDSAWRAEIDLSYDRGLLRDALRRCILDFGVGDVRWRVTVSKARPDQLIITLEPFTPIAPELIENGVRTITAGGAVRTNAAAKTTGWMHQRTALVEAMPPGIYDTILLGPDGEMLEGLAANFYIIKDGVLYTAPADTVLPGISRLIVLEISRQVLPYVIKAPNIAERDTFQEAFITSASRGIVPVVEIDLFKLGDGTPGPLTRRLRAAYEEWITAHLEEI